MIILGRTSLTHILIDGPSLAEFLDKHKGQSIPKEKIKDPNLLERLGIKGIRESEKKALEVFLLRSYLYQVDEEGRCLRPYLIDGNWTDYTKSWRVILNGQEIHIPFRGKISFFCYSGGKRSWICHPESSSYIEKIYVDVGEVTLPTYMGRYKVETCKQILQKFKFDVLSPEHLKEIEKITNFPPGSFLKALVGLKLAIKANEEYILSGYLPSGEKLFFTELEKTQGDTDLEKVAKVLLRRDHQYFMHISTILSWFEYKERIVEPYEDPIGIVSEGKRKTEKGKQFQKIENSCSLNNAVVYNVIEEYSKFGFFIEWYPYERLDHNLLKWVKEYYCFLSCYMDSLGFLSKGEKIALKFFKTKTKREKFKRHLKYLSRFTSSEDFKEITQNTLSYIKEKNAKSEFIDFNPDKKSLTSLADIQVEQSWCPYNVFVVTRVPIKVDLFKEKVIETLKSENKFKDPQGHFYYPDFRFLLCSQLGLSFQAFDNIFAYVLSKDVDFRSRLWFPVLFGLRIRKHRVEDSLSLAVGEPFDSISLRY